MLPNFIQKNPKDKNHRKQSTEHALISLPTSKTWSKKTPSSYSNHTTSMQPENSELYRFLAQNGVGSYGFPANLEFPAMQSFSSSSTYYPLEMSGVTTETTPQDRALAALKNHKEAEKRRRERINSHLNRLRSLLPCNSKTDKASLLAKVVQRVKELKQQTLELTELEAFPSETDEITVLSCDYSIDGRLIFKASLCCEDRSDLLPELIEILKSLHLKTLKAEMATLGGRIRNVLIVAADKDHSIESVHFLQNALKSLLERSNSSDRSKRRRVLDHKIMV
ncbi:transcription factor bHLH106 [Herrania umbratica]|uniref:Transcription factor bHLH106 n=1 Tax=Herrania umbratica TaxID=108875 RepID=A0A6J1BE51_9ROSI|nr:transcription factor bHLH106 [Herrania umbratica]